MSYEYGTGQQGLNYPNPYVIQNKFLFIKVILFGLASLGLFLLAKNDLDKNMYSKMIIELIFSFLFVAYTLSMGLTLSKQVRVFFGRGQPASLAPEVPLDHVGTSTVANQLKETIRQGALIIDTPNVPFSGFLYNWFKDLIIAPKEIRTLTEHVFGNIIKTGILIGCFSLSTLFSYNTNVSGYLGLFFIFVTSWLVIKPLLKSGFNEINITLGSFWKLLLLSVCFPIFILFINKSYPNVLHNLDDFNFSLQSVLILVIILFAEFLNLWALNNQLIKPDGITTSFEQKAVTFNAHPNQLLVEIERKLQSNWVATIPNRIYSKIIPQITNDTTGNFYGLVMQESQPMAPESKNVPLTLVQAINDSKMSKLLYIECLGFLLNLICLSFIFSSIYNMHSNNIIYGISWLPLIITFLSLSSYLNKLCHELWGRFDFESTLYVFEWQGNFNKAKMNFGNHLKDTIQSEKNIINIDGMTLRVWVTQLYTVVFGHGINSNNNPRKIIKMVGLKEDCKNWLNHIVSFAESQSMILKPTSKEDFKNANSLSQLNSLSAQANEYNKNNIDPTILGSLDDDIQNNHKLKG